jgi:hypothetical protein
MKACSFSDTLRPEKGVRVAFQSHGKAWRSIKPNNTCDIAMQQSCLEFGVLVNDSRDLSL